MKRTLLALLVVLSAACSREPARPNVLLITIDTLRADRLSALGSARKTTPRIDELAAEGLVFTHAQTPRAKTTPAIASLMTGLYPHDHGVRDLVMPLESRFPTLPEVFRRAGYATGAIVGNFVLKDAFAGLARGFDQWTEDLPDQLGVPPDEVPQRTARSMTDGALTALGLAPAPADARAGPRATFVRDDAPWFLWLHYMDPHGSYDPPTEHRVFQREHPDPIPPPRADPDARRQHVAEYNVPASARMDDGRIDAALVRDLYDGEVRYVDAEIGRLIDALRARGLLENTLVVITSDHGESLGEHDYWFEHGRDVYEASTRVPLVVRFPDRWESLAREEPRPAPGTRRGDVSLADLGPTILDLLKLPPLQPGIVMPATSVPVRGESRAALCANDERTPRAVFCEKIDRRDVERTVQAKSVRAGDWKLIRHFTVISDASSPHARMIQLGEELYDLARDPHETDELMTKIQDTSIVWRLQKELGAFTLADRNFAELAADLERQRERLRQLDPQTLRTIEALGY
ncbi:MAG: sulfatase [Planctomycetota bacterium]